MATAVFLEVTMTRERSAEGLAAHGGRKGA